MKPDGVATAPPEPTEALGAEPVAEAAANEEQPQGDPRPSLPQAEEQTKEEERSSTAPPTDKKPNGKMVDPKTKAKVPVKTKPGTAGAKATTATTPSRPVATQNRTANGVARTAASGAAKKPTTTTTEAKKTAPVGGTAQTKKVATAAGAGPKTQTKVAERKPVATTRPTVAPTNSGTKPSAGATSASSTLSRKPAAAVSSSVVPKTKTTAPRPATAPAARPSAPTTSRTAPAPKGTRPQTSAPASRSTASKPTVSSTKPAAAMTTARSASSQPSKVSSMTAAAKKDIGKSSTTAAARTQVGSTTTTTSSSRLTATKPSRPEPQKPATVAKRLPANSKTTQPKPDEPKSVPTRKVPPSSRNTLSRPASSKLATSANKPAGSSTPVAVKRQLSKPTQSVSPLVIKAKPTEEEPPSELGEHAAVSVSAIAAAVATSVVATESVSEVNAAPEQLEERPNHETSNLVQGQIVEELQVTASEPLNVETLPTNEMIEFASRILEPAEPEASFPFLSDSTSVPVGQESKKVDEDYISIKDPAALDVLHQEPVTASSSEVHVVSATPVKATEFAEKAEQILHNYEEEEEEREGSQQVSLSEMSGTQPTEESRPGSAGLAGSVWRAGGLLSELDSEDVSCSQQGASELSAPGVLEGTESMDDLGDASLKGADGDGVSAGSPDLEKVPDIPATEDDDDDDEDYDDEDRVYDMEVGSERAEDPHKQCHYDEDEDEDVEMASEGVTESGLESYGNADEDDFAEDYRLDNLNRMQPPPIVPSAPPGVQWGQANPFADPLAQALQPDPSLLSSLSSKPFQADSETPTQAPTQPWLDFGNAGGGPSSHYPTAFVDPTPNSPRVVPVSAEEMDAGFKPIMVPHSEVMPQSSTLSVPELETQSCSNSSTPEELKDNISPEVENQQQKLVLVDPVPVALPDIMQDLGVCLEQGDDEEEPETLPADDVLGGPATGPTSAPSSPSSSATEDEASDTEGEMQISDPNAEPIATGGESFGNMQVSHTLSAVEEREETCAEVEGGGGSDTPQSATSAASYGFDCTTTSNSNAQSTTESCAKSPGIFSLENEEQLPDEAKDPTLIQELTLTPTCLPGDDGQPKELDVQQRELDTGELKELQPNTEQQYMLCGKVGEESYSVGDTGPFEAGLVNPSSSQHQEEHWDLDAQHPYYSTICEKTDSSVAGREIHSLRHQDVITIHVTMSPKPRFRQRADHVNGPPRLPTDLPPRIPSVGPNAQLRRLEQHQQHLLEMEKRRELQSRQDETQEENGEKEKPADEKQEVEEKFKVEDEEETELEKQRRDHLQLQIQQQQEELKQRQQIIQWQQELEQQSKHQSKHKAPAPVLLSPSGLCTIYEALEPTDAEEDCEDRKNKKEHLNEGKEDTSDISFELSGVTEEVSSPTNVDTISAHSQSTPSPELVQNQTWESSTAAPDIPPFCVSDSVEQPSPLDLDWDKKVDIVQQLINQTLLLAGDSCSPLLLLPGGPGGTLSPLETSLWPNLLPALTPSSATVTSVSSFSPEASGSSPQGEWTVVELETHH